MRHRRPAEVWENAVVEVRDFLGHEEVVEQFARCLSAGRLASSFLFVGPPGVGKRTFANRLAQALLCERSATHPLAACGHCSSCQLVAAGTHPDLDVVERPQDRAFIPLELLIGDPQHRLQEGLCHRLSLRPFRGGYRIAILDDADYLNAEGANCLLKTLEEPPPRSVLILVGTSQHKQLPTIRSRCQLVRFRPLPEALLERLLLDLGHATDPAEARQLARLGQGSLERALFWQGEEVAQFRRELYGHLSATCWDPVTLGKVIGAFVDRAGKEAAARRQRFKLVIDLATDYFHQLLRRLCGAGLEGDDVLAAAVDQGERTWRGDCETVNRCIERCLSATPQVDSNANQATLLECWLDDLSRLCWRLAPRVEV
ncbi:MAG: DNA polymerase III subunit [Pirellulaceae bacterium]|nr:DNA polymerase III subunit [Pirellulaceae bacterium]